MKEELDTALKRFAAARKELDAADDALYKIFRPIVEEAANKGAGAVHEAMKLMPESVARFRLWQEFQR